MTHRFRTLMITNPEEHHKRDASFLSMTKKRRDERKTCFPEMNSEQAVPQHDEENSTTNKGV